MGKKDKKKNKGKGAEKTAAKTEKKLCQKLRKRLATLGEVSYLKSELCTLGLELSSADSFKQTA